MPRTERSVDPKEGVTVGLDWFVFSSQPLGRRGKGTTDVYGAMGLTMEPPLLLATLTRRKCVEERVSSSFRKHEPLLRLSVYT